MSFMLVWLRLSTMKQLDWYRNSSYQSKDIAHVQKTITQRFADKVSTCRSGVPCNCITLPAEALAALAADMLILAGAACTQVPHSMSAQGRGGMTCY